MSESFYQNLDSLLANKGTASTQFGRLLSAIPFTNLASHNVKLIGSGLYPTIGNLPIANSQCSIPNLCFRRRSIASFKL